LSMVLEAERHTDLVYYLLPNRVRDNITLWHSNGLSVPQGEGG